MLICNLKKNNGYLKFISLVNPKFHRFFSLKQVKPLKKVAQNNESMGYRFYDSPLFQPVFKKTFVNFRKPEFENKVNIFGDLPNVLIKNSK